VRVDKRLKKRVVGGVQRFNPAESALRIHTTEAAEKIAVRAKNVEALEAAVLGKLEAQRDFAAAYRESFPRGGDGGDSKAPVLASSKYCERFGFAHRTVQRWAERLLDADDGFERERSERLGRVCRIMDWEQAANFSSASSEWYTPERYIEAVRRVLGGIDLDPASSEMANKTVRAGAYFGRGNDGLAPDWWGRVFLNPPYGRTAGGDSLAAAFCNKALEEHRAGRVSRCIILVNSLHSQSWQAPLYAFPICLVHHRIQFVSRDGEENKSPTFQNMFVYLGDGAQSFAEVFGALGYVVGRLAA
jgi:hypothetical protein